MPTFSEQFGHERHVEFVYVTHSLLDNGYLQTETWQQ